MHRKAAIRLLNRRSKPVITYFDKKLAEVTEHYPYVQIVKVNHDKDYIHMLVSIPRTMAVGKAVGIIKQNTARE